MDPRFTFITSYKLDYSRSGVLLSYLSKKDLVTGVIKFSSWKFLSVFASQILKANKKTDYYVIMNPSQFLTPVVRVLTNKKIILDGPKPLCFLLKEYSIKMSSLFESNNTFDSFSSLVISTRVSFTCTSTSIFFFFAILSFVCCYYSFGF